MLPINGSFEDFESLVARGMHTLHELGKNCTRPVRLRQDGFCEAFYLPERSNTAGMTCDSMWYARTVKSLHNFPSGSIKDSRDRSVLRPVPESNGVLRNEIPHICHSSRGAFHMLTGLCIHRAGTDTKRSSGRCLRGTKSALWPKLGFRQETHRPSTSIPTSACSRIHSKIVAIRTPGSSAEQSLPQNTRYCRPASTRSQFKAS
jgi:hypothetical protein